MGDAQSAMQLVCSLKVGMYKLPTTVTHKVPCRWCAAQRQGDDGSLKVGRWKRTEQSYCVCVTTVSRKAYVDDAIGCHGAGVQPGGGARRASTQQYHYHYCCYYHYAITTTLSFNRAWRCTTWSWCAASPRASLYTCGSHNSPRWNPIARASASPQRAGRQSPWG